MIPTAIRYYAEGMTNRGGCNPYNRRRKRERCIHLHRSEAAARRCAKSHQKRETRPWHWRVETVMFILFDKKRAVRYCPSVR